MALDVEVDGDAFETVAITWSQPEAAVMLSMFDFYGIPAFALGRWQASIDATLMVAMQGIQVRVHHLARDEALDLLAEVAERPAAVRPYLFGLPWLYRGIVGLAVVMMIEFYLTDEPSALMMTVAIALSWIFVATPPTRTPSTFMLWKRSRHGPAPDEQ